MKLLDVPTSTVHFADCLDVLRGIPDNSLDSIVTDAPYGLGKPPPILEVLECWIAGRPWVPKGKAAGFMGHAWDAFVPGPEVWRECFRVLKPGAHMAVFAGTRTQDVMGLAIRIAGFEIRDGLQYLFGSGFPKSLNVSKAIDDAAGAEREVVSGRKVDADNWTSGGRAALSCGMSSYEISETAPATEAAKQWDGWGTALKPAVEPIILARKPLEGTVAANVLKHGTGALNVDGCRIEYASEADRAQLSAGVEAVRARGGVRDNSWKNTSDLSGANPASDLGRFPANIILDEQAASILDSEVGNRPGMSGGGSGRRDASMFGVGGVTDPSTVRGDNGGPSRFFYTAKVGKSERHEGCHLLPRTNNKRKRWRQDMAGTWEPRALNVHPTVKGIELMRWLCRLVTPKGGVLLDLFIGSGSTGCAAALEGFRFIGCDSDGRSAHTAAARIRHFLEVAKGAPRRRRTPVRKEQKRQLSLLEAIA